MRILIALFLAGVALQAYAQNAELGETKRSYGFDRYDKNSDQYVTRAEVGDDQELAKRFKRFDANHDGKLSEDEFLKAKRDEEGQVLSDSAITAKLKTALLMAKGVPSFSISVKTYEGRVQLSGFVKDREQIARAGKAAAAVSGVHSVKNDLAVK